MIMKTERIQKIQKDWDENPRWKNIHRPYTAEEVVNLQGSVPIEHSIARITAEKLWKKLNDKPFVAGLGALTGNQAVQEIAAGLEAIYLSGWQVAADANLAGGPPCHRSRRHKSPDLSHHEGSPPQRTRSP